MAVEHHRIRDPHRGDAEGRMLAEELALLGEASMEGLVGRGLVSGFGVQSDSAMTLDGALKLAIVVGRDEAVEWQT
jgi:hypothetical protein